MASPIPAGNGFSSDSTIADILVAETYRAYSAFCELALSMSNGDKRDLAHQLVLCEPLSVAGEAPVIAASMASAGSLTIESVASAARQASRSGAIDFTVNNLDEALRALRNEIRKGLSIAVCLEGDRDQILIQMVQRGIQPDVICSSGSADPDPLLAPFLENGAHLLDLRAVPINANLNSTSWRVRELPGKWLPMVDEVIAACLPSDDYVRRNWLKRAPRYLDKQLRTERYLPMTENEKQCCASRLAEATEDSDWKGIGLEFKSGNWHAEFRPK